MLKYQYPINRANAKVRDYVSYVQGTDLFRGVTATSSGKVFDPKRPHERCMALHYHDMKGTSALPTAFQSEESVDMRATAKNPGEADLLGMMEAEYEGFIRDNIRKSSI